MYIEPISRPEFSGALNCARAMISDDALLRPSVLDLQEYDETLVAFVDANLPKSYVAQRLASVWPGNVEVYNGTNIMIGC